VKYTIILLSIILCSCQYFQPKLDENVEIIAKVGDEVLTKIDLEELFPSEISKSDSSKYAEKFVNDWVKKQLMIMKAEEVIDFNQAQIKNKVLDYQYALMVHEYEREYINRNLDDSVSHLLIENYYNEKSENFILRENLVKCLYVKFPNNSPNIRRFKNLFRRYPKDSTQFWEYSNEFSIKTFSDQNLWVKFDEVIAETPLENVSDKKRFLESSSSFEASDENHSYYIKILDKKLIGEIAPLSYIEESVKSIILNNRKIKLKKELEKRIYEEAVQENEFEIYYN